MKYEVVIGLEVHAELSTKSKAFRSCSTTFGADPNTQCCPVCIGMPGVLPIMNKKALEYTIRAGLALNCSIAKHTKWDRKNYFYPDLPRACQISQYDMPVCQKGYLDIVAMKKQNARYKPYTFGRGCRKAAARSVYGSYPC